MNPIKARIKKVIFFTLSAIVNSNPIFDKITSFGPGTPSSSIMKGRNVL